MDPTPDSAPTGGRRRVKLTRVTKKKANRALKKLGLKLRGGADAPPSADLAVLPGADETAVKTGGAQALTPAPAGGRRRKTRRSRRGFKLF